MPRTLTVKGTGNVKIPPDMTVVSMTLRSLNKDYEKSMAQSAEQLAALKKSLASVGFKDEDLKTSSFNVCTERESVRDKDGNYKSVFAGYACIQSLMLEFDFDTVRLGKVLSAISSSVADPELNISFTVRDKNAVSDALLRSATENARAKAEILASASGVKLQSLLSIDYNWGNINIVSNTGFMMEKRCMAMNDCCEEAMAFTPEDISVTDNVTFVWEIA